MHHGRRNALVAHRAADGLAVTLRAAVAEATDHMYGFRGHRLRRYPPSEQTVDGNVWELLPARARRVKRATRAAVGQAAPEGAAVGVRLADAPARALFA